MKILPFALTIACSLAGLVACQSGPDDQADEGAAAASEATSADLHQGWTAEQGTHYDRSSDGSGIFNYKWLKALEAEGSDDLWLSEANVRRYGFIPDPKNPDGLPVGLAKQVKGDMVGSTCSACHTGEITYKGTTMRIHGGEGTSQVSLFVKAAYMALLKTVVNPLKFKRFADRVFGEDVSLAKLDLFFSTVKQTCEIELKILVSNIEMSDTAKVVAGPFRNDAVGTGINRTAGPVTLKNLRQPNAPVSMPHVWDTPRFDWVEYNGAFEQPMTRNIISALARGADLSFETDGKPGFKNGVDLVKMDEIEKNLGKLKAPVWPESVLGAIDQAKAARGKVLYNTPRGADKQSCATCHNPPTDKRGHLAIVLVPLADIGTDPMQANNWANRTVDMDGKLGLGVIPVTEFARMATQGVLDRNYAELGISAAKQEDMNGNRPNGWQAPRAYRSRPLEGVWATAPFLHNGSVPNLYQLLLPDTQRIKSFKTGSKEMDPKNVGLVMEGDPRQIPDMANFVLDTTIDANHNTGHTGAKYGTDLADAERWDLIEYMKTL